MTDHKVALVLPTETDIELLAEDVEVARGYAERSLSAATRAAYRPRPPDVEGLGNNPAVCTATCPVGIHRAGRSLGPSQGGD